MLNSVKVIQARLGNNAFYLTSPKSELENKNDIADKKDLEYKLIPGASSDPSITVGYASELGDHYYGIFSGSTFMGYTAFEEFSIARNIDDSRDFLKHFRPGVKFYLPHATLTPKFRGLGLVSTLYKLVLKRNTVLIAQAHTPAASKVWRNLGALDKKLALKVYSDVNGTLTDFISDKAMQEEDFKILCATSLLK
jgi:hypothetical protein